MTEMPSEIFALPQRSSLYTHTLGPVLALAKESILYSLGPSLIHYISTVYIHTASLLLLPP